MGSREIARSKDVTANSTEKVGKAGKVGPRPWEIESYIYKEEPEDAKRSSHDDPRLELALQRLSLHQDDFIPSDDDHGSGYSACGLGVTPDLHASASSASDQGTLAGVKQSAAGDYARRNMSDAEYQNFQDYKHAIYKRERPTQEQKDANTTYHKGLRAFNDTLSKRTGAARWRATRAAMAQGVKHGVVHRAWQ